MIVGVQKSIPYVIESIPETKIEGEWLKRETIKSIETLHSLGFSVRAVIAAVAQWLRASNKFVSQHLSGAGSSPTGSVGRDLNLQKSIYQYLTTSVAIVLDVR